MSPGIIKTNSSGHIKDAYQYTLEWADVPSTDLYKAHIKNLVLSKETTISQMNFKRVNHSYKDDQQLHEDGSLSFSTGF